MAGTEIRGTSFPERIPHHMSEMPRKSQHLGDRLHSLLLQAYGIKQRDFSHEAVDRAMAALNAARGPRPPMVGEVLWMGAPVFFTPCLGGIVTSRVAS